MNNSGTMLWLSGWSIDDSVFDALRSKLPEWRHVPLRYYEADSPERMYAEAKAAAEAGRGRGPAGGPLLIAGWSLGGLTALRLAGELKPDGLVLLGATACFVRPKGEAERGWPDAYLRQMCSALTQDRISVEQKFRAALFTPRELKRGLPGRLPEAGLWPIHAMLAGLERLRREDCRPLLPGIGCPVLVVHGRDDTVCPFGAAEELDESLPHASLFAVEHCGHAPFLGREPETADAIRSWWYDRER